MKIPITDNNPTLPIQTVDSSLKLGQLFKSAANFLGEKKKIEQENYKIQQQSELNNSSINLNNGLMSLSEELNNSDLDVNETISKYNLKFTELFSENSKGLSPQYKAEFGKIAAVYNSAIFKGTIKDSYIRRNKKYRKDLDDNLLNIQSLAPENRNAIEGIFNTGKDMIEKSKGWNNKYLKDMSEFKTQLMYSSLKTHTNNESFFALYDSFLDSNETNSKILTPGENKIYNTLDEQEKSTLAKKLYDNYNSWNSLQKIQNDKEDEDNKNLSNKSILDILNNDNVDQEKKLNMLNDLGTTYNLNWKTITSLRTYLKTNESDIDKGVEDKNLAKLLVQIYSNEIDLMEIIPLLGSDISAKTFNEKILPKWNALNNKKMKNTRSLLEAKYAVIPSATGILSEEDQYKVHLKNKILHNILERHIDDPTGDVNDFYDDEVKKAESTQNIKITKELQNLNKRFDAISKSIESGDINCSSSTNKSDLCEVFRYLKNRINKLESIGDL